MADKILHKRSSTPSAVPSAASLELGEIALNTADGRAFMKKSNGSVVEIGSTGSAFFSLVTVTATSASQTSFTIPGGYTPGAIVVFLNGSSLAPAHYTATNGTAVVLGSGTGVVVGSELVVLRLSAFEVANALPLGGTAADSNKLGGQPPEFYLGGGSWGSITGTLANQTDLKNALDAKVTGQAQQNATDGAAGRVLLNGAFGIPTNSNYRATPTASAGTDGTTDWNTITSHGWWHKLLGNNNPNNPGGGSGYWYCLVLTYEGGNCTQVAFPYGTGFASGTIKWRTLFSGTWSAWSELFHAGNLTITAFARTLLDDADAAAARATLGAVGADSFSSSLAATGYQRLHGGLIIQWGSVSVGANTTAAVTFPIAFPNACLRVINGLEQTGTASTSWGWVPVAYNKTATGMTVTNGNTAITVSWIAFGY